MVLTLKRWKSRTSPGIAAGVLRKTHSLCLLASGAGGRIRGLGYRAIRRDGRSALRSPRGFGGFLLRARDAKKGHPVRDSPLTCEWVFPAFSPAAMPGGVLLFQRLSVSTIGAAWFHGRVRDGIGWVTGAMTTKQ